MNPFQRTLISLSAVAAMTLNYSQQGYLGGNVSAPSDYGHVRLYNNAIHDSRGFGILGTNVGPNYSDPTLGALSFSAVSGSSVTMTISGQSLNILAGNSTDLYKVITLDGGKTATVIAFESNVSATVSLSSTLSSTNFAASTWTASVGVDTNGHPLNACQIVVSATPGSSGDDGQLAAGTYRVTVPFRMVGQSATLGGSYNTSMSNISYSADGLTQYFTVTLLTGAGFSLNLSGGLSGLIDIPRDGSASSVAQPLFNTTPIAFYARWSSIRLMDFLGTNNRADTTWATRPSNYVMQAGLFPSWERAHAFMQAIYTSQGARTTKFFTPLPGTCVPDYGAQLALLRNSLNIPAGIIIFNEYGNEPWNYNFKNTGAYLTAAGVETQVIANYAITSTIASVVGDGSNITVTMTVPIPSYITAGGVPCIAAAYEPSWNLGSLTTPVIAKKTGTNTFAIPSTMIGSPPSDNNRITFYFNLSSNLLTDNLSFDLYELTGKYYVRAAYEVEQSYSVNRPQDRWYLNVSLYGSAGSSGAEYSPLAIKYAEFINGGSATWLYGVATGNYVATSSASTTVDQVFAELNSLLPTAAAQVRAHVYTCLSAGLHPLSYEWGRDLQASSQITAECMSDPRMGAFHTALADTLFQNGMEECNFYTLTPGTWLDSPPYGQGCWPIAQSYTDNTSPTLLALLAYFSKPVIYSNIFGSPGTLEVANSESQSRGAIGGNGMLDWYLGQTPYYAEFLAAFNSAAPVTITPYGSDASAGTVVSVYVSGTLVGTSTLPANGSASNAATVPGPGAPITYTPSSAGVKIVRVVSAAGSNPGVSTLAIH